MRKYDCLVATLRKGLQVWRNYTQNVRDAWKERAKLLNAVPGSGLLPSCLKMFWAFNGGVGGVVVTALFHDWNCLCNFIQKSIQKEWTGGSQFCLLYKFGDKTVMIGKQIHR